MVKNIAKAHGSWKVICKDKDGNIKWEDNWDNLIVGEGLAALLNYTIAARFLVRGESINFAVYV